MFSNKVRTAVLASITSITAPSVQALTPYEVGAARSAGTLKEINIIGSSGQQYLLAGYIQVALAEPGTLDIYADVNTAGQEDHLHRAYAFRAKAQIGDWPAGTPILVTKSDNGGSGAGVSNLLNGGNATQRHILVDSRCSTNGGVVPELGVASPNYLCLGEKEGRAHAALIDVEPSIMQQVINGGTNSDVSTLDSAPYVQSIFAVATNSKLYFALQKSQGLVPLTANGIDESATAQPSLPRAFIAGALTGQLLGSSASEKGWNLVIPFSVDSNISNKRINVCRRVPGSGAQAVSNIYFANNPCGAQNLYNPNIGTTGAIPSVTGSITTKQNLTTAHVENCLANVDSLEDDTGGAYAFGVLSRHNFGIYESNGELQERNFRFVKLSGASPTRESVNKGDYDFVFTSQMAWAKPGVANSPTAEILALLQKIRSEMGSAATLSQLQRTLSEGYLALPSTIPPGISWFRLNAVTQGFTAHSSRSTSNSCSVLRMNK